MSRGPTGSPNTSPETPLSRPEGGAWARLSRRLRAWTASRRPAAAGCRACGACCEHFGGHLRASKPDLERWRAEGRDDLLSRVNRLGWIWVDPASGAPLDRCPFLERVDPESSRCAIHHTKPEMCRSYPTLAHGRQCVRGITVH